MEVFRKEIERNGGVSVLSKSPGSFSIVTPGGEHFETVSRKLTQKLLHFNPAGFSCEQDVLNAICATVDEKSRLESCRLGDKRIFIRNFQKLSRNKVYIYQMKIQVDANDCGEVCFMKIWMESFFNMCIDSEE